jgi:hypothetical protein
MQSKLKESDFVKVRKFINNESSRIRTKIPLVKELSSTELYIGECYIVMVDECWHVTKSERTAEFNSKRNAMYYAFLIAYNNKRLIPELKELDYKIGHMQSDIVRFKYYLTQTKDDNFKTGLYHNKLSESVARYRKAKTDLLHWMDYAKCINHES